MGMSTYGNGSFADGITIRGMPLRITHPGEVFWVNSTTVLPKQGKGPSDGNKGTYLEPFSTVDKALSKCTADRGDIIMVMPGTSTTVSGAAGEVMDVAGVAVVGLGTGTKQPIWTYSADTATITFTADNMTFYNLNFQAATDDCANMLDISAIEGITFQNCLFDESASSKSWTKIIDIATLASDFWFEDCRFIGEDAANNEWMNMVVMDKLVVRNCYFAMTTAQATATDDIVGTDVTDVWMSNNSFQSAVDGALFIDFTGTCSGTIANCYFASIDTAAAITAGVANFTGGNCFECYFAGENDSWGLLGGGAALYNNA